MATLAKPYTITNAAQQSEDIDRMLDELYQAAQDLDAKPTNTGATGAVGAAGPRGADGDEGESGEPGQPGRVGSTGLTGPIGPVGQDGDDGDDGDDGMIGPINLNGGFTAGSVPFVGPSGRLAQDNANLFWDGTNTRLAVGTATPTAKVHALGTQPASQAGAGAAATKMLTVVGGQGGNASGTPGSTGGVGGEISLDPGKGGNTTTDGSGSNTGGIGGALTLDGGNGGNVTGATDVNGTGGNVIIAPGAPGTGGTGGAYGNVIIAASGGNVGIGTTSPSTATKLTLAGGGITFPGTQTASAGANDLDDYEEGTWTPTIGGSTSESGQAYSIQTGNYIKIGLYVFVTLRVDLSTLGTITGSVMIKGLPFAAASGQFTGNVGYFNNLTSNVSSLGSFTRSTFAQIEVYGVVGTQAVGMLALVQADLSNTTIFIMSVGYYV